MAEEQSAVGPATKKDRSPSFPFITLTKGVDRARELYIAARRHDIRLPDAAAAMQYAAKSSGAAQTLAALISFGLVEDNGSGDGRKFRITDLAFKILEDQRPGARDAALAEAALTPKLIAEYADRWGAERPADGICISELRIEGGFTEDGAKLFLRVFDDAMQYSQRQGSPKQTKDNAEQQQKEDQPDLFAVGDWVEVEANGQIVFERTRVRAIDGQWVFVEASQAGCKASDVRLVEKGGLPPELPPVLPFSPERGEPSKPGEKKDRFTIDDGVVEVIFPSEMTSESVDELEAFFALFIKRARRRAAGA